MLISCEVRKPSKKCRNGTRDRSVAACAISARSCASCTEPEDSRAKPVVRVAITSEWSPKIDSACVASARAATWKTVGGQLAGDLEHVGHHQQQALRCGEGRGQRAGLQRAVHRAGSAPFALHLLDDRDVAPDVPDHGLGRPFVGQFRHGGRGRDRKDRADLVHPVGDMGDRGVLPSIVVRACRFSACVAHFPAGSATISIAWQGHCSKQTAQPVQFA